MAAARRLFTDGTREDVAAALASTYEACIRGMTTPKNTLASLDTFWRQTLPATLREREASKEGAYVTKDELYRIMKWKITRGKSRPLLHLIESNDDVVIRRVSREAFAALAKGKGGNEEACVRQAIEIMAGKSVRGVGPATASAVLAAYRGDLVPFMADEAVAAAIPSLGKLKYTLEEQLAFRKAVVARARALGGGVTAEELGQALWAVAKAETLGVGGGGGGGVKRKGAKEDEKDEKGDKEGKGAKKARRK